MTTKTTYKELEQRILKGLAEKIKVGFSQEEKKGIKDLFGMHLYLIIKEHISPHFQNP